MAAAEHPAADFGARMKRTREERGVTLREIADRTKLSVSVLEALERNEISRLPGGIFSRGFVRSYAVEIGLDPEQAVRDFLTQFPHDLVTLGSPQSLPDGMNDEGASRRDARTLVITVAIALVIVVLVAFAVSRP